MKKFSLYLLLAALLLIQVACEKMPDQPINNSTQDKSDVTETGGNGTILYEVPNTGVPTPCVPYVTNLVVNNNISDLQGNSNIVIGTMTVTNTPEELIFLFELPANSNCYITKATGNAWVIDAWDDRYVPPGVRTITETHTDVEGLTTVELRMPYKDIRQIGSKTKDYSFYCDDILALMGSIEVCCPGSDGGNLGSSNRFRIDGGEQYFFMGNDDTDETNGDFSAKSTITVDENDNLVVVYEVLDPTLTLTDAQFIMAPALQCPFPADKNPSPGQFPWGLSDGVLSNGDKTYTLTIPMASLLAYLEDEYGYSKDDICFQDFCVGAHIALSNGETAWAGITKITDKKWYRYFTMSVECGNFGEGEPTCQTAWSFGNSRYCLQLPNVEGRYWYWVTKGYTFCCPVD